MSDIPAGTMVQMRIVRRYHHYNAGDVIAVPLDAGRKLEVQRLATPLHLLVPTVRAPAEPGDPSPSPAPLRQPAGIVRK